MAVEPVLPSEVQNHQSGVCVQPHIAQSQRNARVWEWFLASKFPYRHPVLYGSLLELRNCLHRIQSLRKRGDILPAQIGPVYQQSQLPGCLVQNKRSQGRILGIQKLLSDSPWLTTEDFRLFLAGWDTAEEWRDGLGKQDSTQYRQA